MLQEMIALHTMFQVIALQTMFLYVSSQPALAASSCGLTGLHSREMQSMLHGLQDFLHAGAELTAWHERLACVQGCMHASEEVMLHNLYIYDCWLFLMPVPAYTF